MNCSQFNKIKIFLFACICFSFNVIESANQNGKNYCSSFSASFKNMIFFSQSNNTFV